MNDALKIKFMLLNKLITKEQENLEFESIIEYLFNKLE